MNAFNNQTIGDAVKKHSSVLELEKQQAKAKNEQAEKTVEEIDEK